MGVDGFAIPVVEEYLRSHGVRGAAFLAQDGQLGADGFGKPEVRDFNGVVLQEDILEL